MKTYEGIPVSGGPHISIQGETFLDAAANHLASTHQRLTDARVFEGAAGQHLKRVYVAESREQVRTTRGGKTYRRVCFDYDSLPDALRRVTTGHHYSYDFAVPEDERAGPEVELWRASEDANSPAQAKLAR